MLLLLVLVVVILVAMVQEERSEMRGLLCECRRVKKLGIDGHNKFLVNTRENICFQKTDNERPAAKEDSNKKEE